MTLLVAAKKHLVKFIETSKVSTLVTKVSDIPFEMKGMWDEVTYDCNGAFQDFYPEDRSLPVVRFFRDYDGTWGVETLIRGWCNQVSARWVFAPGRLE